MQTFLPYPDFAASLRVLDYRRLGKQRVEAFQLLRAISGKGSGWSNHPAAIMWRGYDNALKEYHNLAIDEWVQRGYCRVERGHAPAESRRLSLQVQCRSSNDHVSDARVSARSVFIEDEKQGRESASLRSTRH